MGKILVLVFMLLGGSLNGQNLQNVYDLDFSKFNTCSWDWLKSQSNCSMKKLPEYLIIKNGAQNFGPPVKMSFRLSREITLLKSTKHPIRLRLKAKNNSNSNLVFSVAGFDKSQQLILSKEKSLRRTEEWSTIELEIGSVGLKAIEIEIRYEGNTDLQQEIYLAEIELNNERGDFQKFVLVPPKKSLPDLNISHAVQIRDRQTFTVDNLPGITNELQIIGLGECSHGSLSITEQRFEVLKQFIQQRKCSFVLLELPFDDTMLYDLFVQGDINDTTLVKDYLDNKIFAAASSYFRLFEWIRNFNLQSKRKVHLVGLDNSISLPSYALMDIFSNLLPPNQTEVLLKEVGQGNLLKVHTFLSNSKTLFEGLGNETYDLFVHVLGNNSLSKPNENFYFNRDVDMFKRVSNLYSQFYKSDELWVVLAHSKHLQKNDLFRKGEYINTLGSLLHKTKSERYYAIDFSFGTGSFVQDSCSRNAVTIDSISELSPNSFSFNALKIPYERFLYPTSQIKDNIFLSLSIGRYSFKRANFEFTSFKKNFDAIFFIRKSVAFRDFVRYPSIGNITFFVNKERQYYKYLKGSI